MTLSKEVVLEALRCCRDVYPHTEDFLVSRKVAGHTILAVEGTNETTDWITNLKFLIKRDDCHSCLLYTSPSPRDRQKSRMPSSA